MAIRALFWDSDNTIVDTGEMHWRKHRETLLSLGIVLQDDDRERIYTNNGQQNWEWLSRERGLSVSCDDYLQQIDQWYGDHIAEVQMRSGVDDIMTLADAAGIHQAIVSNGRRHSVMMSLMPHNIPARVRFVMCKDDYEGRKPDPAPYLAALARLNAETGLSLQASDCLAIEDDPKGVESAVRAGMTVIHRKLSPDQPDAGNAAFAVYQTNEFVNFFKQITS